MSQPTASFQLPDGRYKVDLGSSFFSNNKDLLYTAQVQNAHLDARSKARRALLKKVKKDNYVMEWNGAEGSLKTGQTYDAHATPHEDVGVLIYDENTKRFTLERPSMHLTMTLKRKNKKQQTSILLPASIEASPASTQTSTASTPSAASAASEPIPTQRKSEDDFEKDLEKDMLEVLGSDSDSEEEKVTNTINDNEKNVTQGNKRKATPEPNTPKRRKIQMASQPIRPLDLPTNNNNARNGTSGKIPALPSRPIRTPSPRRTTGGKTIMGRPPIPRRASTTSNSDDEDDSSSGSSSSENSSGSESSGSESESDSDSSSDGMEELEESINSTLNTTNNHASTRPPPPPPPPSASNSSRPMSLRQLYADDNMEEEEISGSSDDD